MGTATILPGCGWKRDPRHRERLLQPVPAVSSGCVGLGGLGRDYRDAANRATLTVMSAPASSASAPAPVFPVAPILAVNFVGTLGFGIVLPFLVYLVTRLGGNALVYGVMGATYSAFQLVGAPVLGRWSDRFGRRRILLLSQLGTLASWAIFLVALMMPVTPLMDVSSPALGTFTLTIPLAVLFFARALDGITGGNVSVANAYLADITTDTDRTRQFGRMALAGNLGYIAGPALAGLLGATRWGEVPPVVAALLISAIATLLIALTLREVSPCELQTKPERSSVRSVLGQEQKECYQLHTARQLSPREVVALPSVGLLLCLNLLVFLAFNFFYVAFPIYVATELDWTLAETGMFFAVLSCVMVAAQGPLLSVLSKRFPDRILVIAGCLVLAGGFTAFMSPRTDVIYGGMVLLSLGNGVMWPSLTAMLSKATDRSVQGAVQGLASSAGAVASIAGLLAGGLLYSVIGSTIFAVAAAAAVATGIAGLGVRSAPSVVPGA